MSTKYELAEYLVNLNILLDAQASTGIQKSTAVADEYNRVWAQLKDAIAKEQDNETRSSNNVDRGVDKAGADIKGG